jgi:hypothetical protein
MADAENGPGYGQATAHRTVTVGGTVSSTVPKPPNPHPSAISIQFAPSATRLVNNTVAVEDVWIRCPKGHGFATNSGWFSLSQRGGASSTDTLLAPFANKDRYGHPGMTCTGAVQHEFLISRSDVWQQHFSTGPAQVIGELEVTVNGGKTFEATIHFR